MSEMQASKSEILESLNAIKQAAADRHAALLAEARELEAHFPDLSGAPSGKRHKQGNYVRSAASRARQSEIMRQRWAGVRAAQVS